MNLPRNPKNQCFSHGTGNQRQSNLAGAKVIYTNANAHCKDVLEHDAFESASARDRYQNVGRLMAHNHSEDDTNQQ
jgi:hypothetical protein